MPGDRRRRARPRSARRAGQRCRCPAAGRWSRSSAPTASSPPTSARLSASTSRSSPSRATGAKPAASASAAAISTTGCSNRRPGTGRSTRRWPRRWSTSKRAGPGRRDAGRARPRLVRRAAARSGRPWARRRLQPQGHFGLFRPDRRAGRRARRDGDRRRRDRKSPRLAQHRRRRHADRPHRADRGRHPQGLSAGPAERPADGHGADRQRPPRKLRPCADAAHDQYLHARRHGRSGRADHAGSRTASTPRASAAGRSTSPAASSSSPAPRPIASRAASSARRSRARR